MITELEPGLWHCQSPWEVEAFNSIPGIYTTVSLETLREANCKLVGPGNFTTGWLVAALQGER